MTATRNNKAYNAFISAKGRCNNPKNSKYPYYGARGIKFIFQSFDDFLKALGPRPEGFSLDRIDNDGNYEVGNVRWAKQTTQCYNQRIRKDTTYRIKGVSKNRGSFVAYHSRTNIILYRGDDFFLACCARKSWELTNYE